MEAQQLLPVSEDIAADMVVSVQQAAIMATAHHMVAVVLAVLHTEEAVTMHTAHHQSAVYMAIQPRACSSRVRHLLQIQIAEADQLLQAIRYTDREAVVQEV